MACLTAPPPIELPEDACTSESVVVSGHDASLATERKGWRVLRTAENGGKGQRLMVVLPYAEPYVPEPPCCTYRLRVPASCVAYVPEAQGSCCATVRAPCAYQPRACRTYRVPCGAPQVLPSPARIHSIQLNTKNCGRISIFVSGAETGPNNYVGQANVAASFRGGGGSLPALRTAHAPPMPERHSPAHPSA